MNKTFKKFFSLVLAAVIVLSTLTQVGIVASAEETSVLTFTVKNGKATISKADASATVIEIPAEYEGVPVTAVGQTAFTTCYSIAKFVVDENSKYFSADENGVLFNKDKTELVKFPPASDVTEYDIPESVTGFGHYAFRHSTKLLGVSIPSGITGIDPYAFYDCTGLQKVEFPEGLLYISEQAFANCKALTTIDLPDSLISVSLGAFYGCNLTGCLELPASFKPISATLTWSEVFSGPIDAYSVPEDNSYLSTDEKGVLYNKEKTQLLSFPCASEMETFLVPLSVTSVARGAFNKATELKNVECHDGITDFGVRAFGQTGLTSFVFPKGATEVADEMFYVCENLSEVVLSDGITSIGTQAFYYCDALESVEFPDTVTEISERAFYSSGIANIEIPDGVESIGTWMFGWCENLASVTIPSSVVGISDKAFYHCENLTDVYYTGTADEWNSMSIADGNDYLTAATIHYNYGKNQGDLGDNLMWEFDEDTKTLSFYGSGDMLSFDTFEEYPWYSLKEKIEFVYFGNGVTSVGDNAFNGCTALKEAFLGYTVEKVGVNAFAACPSLALVTACAVNFTAEDNSFVGNDERLTLLYNSSSSQVLAYAQEKGIKTIAVSYDSAKDVLRFTNEFVVYEDLGYNLLAKLIQNNTATKYLYFEKLVFDGVVSGLFDVEGIEGVVADEDYLTFKNLYISISAIKGDGEESITFAQLIEKLESGDHEGFLIEIESESGKEKVDFMKTIDHFVTSALKMISKLINLISKAFKRK